MLVRWSRAVSGRHGEPPEHDAGHGAVDHRLARLGEALVVAREAARLPEPRERPLNGLIANDKFCLIATAQLPPRRSNIR